MCGGFFGLALTWEARAGRATRACLMRSHTCYLSAPGFNHMCVVCRRESGCQRSFAGPPQRRRPAALGRGGRAVYCTLGSSYLWFGNTAVSGRWERAMDWMFFLVILILLYVIVSLRVLKQYERGVVFLLGRFADVRGPGLTLIFVPLQQMVRVSLRTVTMQIPSQKIITKDNVSIDIAAVAYYHITDPEKAVIAIENVYNAINQISQTTVRNVVGRFNLDELLADTARINDQIKNVIDIHTEPWGTQVTAVEIKDIVLPENMQRAMAKEAEAERERRAKIVAAEGEYQAAVKLGEAADIITQHPVALQLRTLQTMAEISIEKNSTIIFPAQFMSTVQEAVAMLSKDPTAK
jgi:regulator of protease activity HflC (stomatin/prohibitin superfamily)